MRVRSCAKSLAESFKANNLIGVIQWANVGVGVFLRGEPVFLLDLAIHRSGLSFAHAHVLSFSLSLSSRGGRRERVHVRGRAVQLAHGADLGALRRGIPRPRIFQ